MKRFTLSLLASFLIAGFASAADSKKIVLRWHGQSFFDLQTTKGTRIVFDPHAIDVYGRQVVSADLVLISHLHNDHTQVGVLENQGKFKVIQGLKPADKKTEWNLIDVYAATIPEFSFKAGVHVNYAQSVLRMKDGLPKLKDFPLELGGTGETVPE